MFDKLKYGRIYLRRWRKNNKEKVKAANAKWYAKKKSNKKFFYHRHLDFKYGRGTSEYFKVQSKKQKGKCNICRKKRKLVLDHCHKTKRRRPLVCRQCNTGIGMLCDSIKLLRRAIKHLQQ